MLNRILIVEDSETMIQFYKGLLSQFECHIDIATTFEQAKEYVLEENYDAYVIDINLSSEHKGTDLIGKGHVTPDKCIISSGNLPEDVVTDLVGFYNIGRDKIMVKPPDTKKFVELITDLFDKKEDTVDTTETYTRSERRREAININYREIIKDIKKLSFKQWVTIISILLTISTGMSTYFTYRGYQERNKYKTQLYTYARERFNYFKDGDKVTSRTYVQHTFESEEVEYTLKLYPDGFIRMIITSEDEEPRELWIPGVKYSQETDEKYSNKSLFEILKSTWIKEK